MDIDKPVLAQRVYDCVNMINEVLKSNLQLREANKELANKYEKERAKVYHLNFEMERHKRSKARKNISPIKTVKSPFPKAKVRIYLLCIFIGFH